MPQPPQRNLPIGQGGVAAELGTMDPRAARRRATPVRGAAAKEPPPEEELRTQDDFVKMLVLRPWPGRPKGAKRSGRVRVGHRSLVEGRLAFCHSFTVPMATFEALRAGEPLTAKGATLPDGLPVAPEGVDPTDIAVRCASCGTEQVGCREILFYEE